ncbi:FxsA family protein [Anoxybacteroides tepidamans]|uniref:FxsA family protein n=1 Tax=Anoxybacteroides tepidamans TaxID=265948 RepID=UPI00048438E2|nr:FxsA family protein [Anoxybacillus tepidamans]
MRMIIALFIIIPVLEITLFVISSQTIGIWPTVIGIGMTGIGGAWLAKKQGLAVLQQARWELMNGRLPSEAVLDGICVLAGAIFLLTPGFLTDIIGFLLLLPATRMFFKPAITRWLKSLFETKMFFYMRR